VRGATSDSKAQRIPWEDGSRCLGAPLSCCCSVVLLLGSGKWTLLTVLAECLCHHILSLPLVLFVTRLTMCCKVVSKAGGVKQGDEQCCCVLTLPCVLCRR